VAVAEPSQPRVGQGDLQLTPAYVYRHVPAGSTHPTGAINDANHTLIGDASTYLGNSELADRYALRYDGIVDEVLFSAQDARHKEKNPSVRQRPHGDTIEYIDDRNSRFQTGGSGSSRTVLRPQFSAVGHTLTPVAHRLRRRQSRIEDQTANVIRRMSGGQQVEISNNPTTRPAIYSHFY